VPYAIGERDETSETSHRAAVRATANVIYVQFTSRKPADGRRTITKRVCRQLPAGPVSSSKSILPGARRVGSISR